MEKLTKILKVALRVLKIAVAVLMFLLGLLNEGASVIDPSDEPANYQIDTVQSSLWGFGIAAVTGWPLLYGCGQAVMSLLG